MLAAAHKQKEQNDKEPNSSPDKDKEIKGITPKETPAKG
jgi:hypothetical protein